jgi:hypothetical protein
MKNPITDQVYEDPHEFVESLIDSYMTNRRSKHQVDVDELEILSCLNKAAGFSEEVVGKFEAVGISQKAVVERKLNTTYEKERGDPHPLRKLLALFESLLEGKIRVDYKESGKKIQDFINRVSKSGVGSEEEMDLLEALQKVRRQTQGKPGITIKDLNPVEVTEEPEYERPEA